MFDHYHYVPVLRWRQGERLALRNLRDDVRKCVTPLIEIYPVKRFEAIASESAELQTALSKTITEIKVHWGPSTCFGDWSLMSRLSLLVGGVHAFTWMIEFARAQGLKLIPVTGIRRQSSYTEALAAILHNTEESICLRLTSEDIESSNVQNQVTTYLASINRSKAQTHLVADLGITAEGTQSFAVMEQRLNDLHEYRTYTLVSGAFPRDLSEFEKNRSHTHERADWISWRNQATDSTISRMRIPTYGDYSIQFPIVVALPPFCNPSASIRYTSRDYWIIMRGEGLLNKDGPGSRQYPANASLLCERTEYSGVDFSEGDKYIHDISLLVGQKKGTPTKLTEAGINHHITVAVRQIAQLFSA